MSPLISFGQQTVQGFDQGIHLQPELASAGLPSVPGFGKAGRLLAIVCTIGVAGLAFDVKRDRKITGLGL